MRSMLALLGITLALALPAAPVLASDLSVSDPWARPTPPGSRVGAGYVQILNGGDSARRLLSAESPLAGSMEIHTMIEEDGMMRMRKLAEGLEIPAGGRVELKPGAEHLMFFSPTQAFVEGETIPVTLIFDGEERLEVPFIVSDRSGRMHGGHGAHAH
ncbi:MAG: copper chaperone PCu(A)C [Aquimonas sp.]|nr:copper chaperone PCu(A)C [Aquimonas sp.]